jgi:hypothetical protein
VAAIGTLASFVTEVPYRGQRLGVMAPGVVRAVGDVADLAALGAPRRLVIAGGVAGDGNVLTPDQLRDAYQSAAHVWSLLDAASAFSLLGETSPAQVIRALR